jgi:hypothetical protein
VNRQAYRENMMKTLLEMLHIHDIYVFTEDVLLPQASGRPTGPAMVPADGSSIMAPAEKHYVLSRAILRLDLAGRDFTEETKGNLTERGYSVTDKAGREIVCYTKDKLAHIALDLESKTKAATENPVKRKTYELLDGFVITLGSERLCCPELLVGFRLIIGRASDIHNKTSYSFAKQVDTRKVFYANMALPDFSIKVTSTGEHVVQEFTLLAPVTTKFEIARPSERK